MSKSSSNSLGIGVWGLLGVCFVVLKLIGKIDWSWWYVTLPFWGGTVLVVFIFVIAFLLLFIAEMLKKIKK